MKVCSLLVLAVVAVACCAEDSPEGTTDSPASSEKVGDLKASGSYGFGYHGAYPHYGGHYGYPYSYYSGYPYRFYGGYPYRVYGYPYYGYPYRKPFGYPYFGVKAYPLTVWG